MSYFKILLTTMLFAFALHASDKPCFEDKLNQILNKSPNKTMSDGLLNEIQDIVQNYSLKKVNQQTATENIMQILKKDPFFLSVPEKNRIEISEWILESQITGLRLKFANYRMILQSKGIDPDLPPKSFAKLARTYGIRSLEHETSEEKIFEILKSKSLKPKKMLKNQNALVAGPGGDQNFIYLRAVHNPSELEFPTEQVFIEFDPQVLDRFKWSHANPDAYEGGFFPLESAKPSYMLGYILESIDPAKKVSLGSGNEILFSMPIKLGKVEFRVHTSSEVRTKLLERLKREKISPPPGKKWEDLILVR